MVGITSIPAAAQAAAGKISGAVATASAATGKIASVVTADMMGGVLDEVIALLPVCIPVMISFIGLRKGVSFISSVLHAA